MTHMCSAVSDLSCHITVQSLCLQNMGQESLTGAILANFLFPYRYNELTYSYENSIYDKEYILNQWEVSEWDRIWKKILPFGKNLRNFPGGPVVKTALPVQQAWVQSLVWKLKSCTPTARPKK